MSEIESGTEPAERPKKKSTGKGTSSKDGTATPSKAKKKTKRPEPKPVLTEAQIDAPSINTLIMLGVISISTLVLWAAGRAACNYHVPGESLTPRAVSLEERTRTAKDVGIEFGHALAGADFDTAKALVRGDAAQLVGDAEKACGACVEEKARREKLLSRGIVHQANSVDAVVEVQTFLSGKQIATRYLGIEREERKWRVTRSFDSLDGAELIPPDFADSPISPETDEPESEARDDSNDDEPRPLVPAVPAQVAAPPKQGPVAPGATPEAESAAPTMSD